MENARAVATTTTIRILATPLRPDAGTARVPGRDVASQADAVRARASLTGHFALAGADPDRRGEPRHDRPPARSSAVARQDAGW
jgi:hypothetical protein